KEGNGEKGKGIMQSAEDHRKDFSKVILEVFSTLRIKENTDSENPTLKDTMEKDEEGFTLVINGRKSKYLSKSEPK
ncbi:hypothetical protein KI387_026808, partial [Taxus chinensis]